MLPQGECVAAVEGRTARPILLVTELFPPVVGGSAVLFEEVYSRIKRIGVTVLTDDGRRGRSTTSSSGLHIIARPLAGPAWGVLAKGAFRRHLRVARELRALTRTGPAIVHCGRVLPEGLAALLNRSLGGPRYIVWSHGEEITGCLSSRELTFLMKRVYGHAAVVVANSRNTGRMLAQLGIPDERIAVIYPGVDASRFHPAVDGSAIRTRLAPSGETVLLSVGRVERRKGHDLVLAALRSLGDRLGRYRYVIVGNGTDRGRLETLVAEYGLGDRVQFVGVVPSEELPAYYAASDVFLTPNRLEQFELEGFGIVFLEAAAAGKPVVGGTTGGVPEAVEDGVTGLLVSGTDVSELAEVIHRLVVSEELRRRLGRAGRERVLRRFTWDRAAEAVAQLHTQIASNSRSHAGVRRFQVQH